MRNTSIFETITTRGSLLPSGFLMKLAGKTGEVERTKPQDYNHSGQKMGEVISRAWNTLQVQWEHFTKTQNPSTAQTREKWLIPLFRELDYGNLKRAEKQTIDGKDYPISHTRDNVPIHLLGTQIQLDHRTPGRTRQIPHSMFQEYLNKTQTPLWGILTNGLKLRVLRENASMTRQAYIEFDLQKMMEGKIYSDFVLLYLICHESRFIESRFTTDETTTATAEEKSTEQKETGKKQTQIIEAWSQTAKKDGIRALDSLRTGVKQAIEALGRGFLNNRHIRIKLRDSEAYKQNYYRQLLRAVYRMIFLLTAESRNLLLDPDATDDAKDRYNRYYSITRIRNLAEKRRGTRHKDLWQALNITLSKLCSSLPTPALGITPLGSFLWNTQATEDLNEATLENRYLLQAIRAITQTTKQSITTRVDYRNLGSEELGSIYESLLEMKPVINADARQFSLTITAGNERKTTGSYYTPTELINELLNSALDPVIKTKTTEEEILNTRICDPACGSGHFLIAASHRMARHLAAKRTQEEEPDPGTYRTALRDVISHCIYGVDINPMSVELCKVSLWLEAIEPGKPLSFLDHHIKCGNSLIGTSPTLMIDSEVSEKNKKFISIPDAAFQPITGDDRKTAAALKKANKTQRKSTARDFFYSIADETDTVKQIALQVAEIDNKDDSTINQLKQKEIQYRAVTTSNIFSTEKTKADLWCAAFVQSKTQSNTNPITTDILRAFDENPRSLNKQTIQEVKTLAAKYRFFHWYIEFPEVFQRQNEHNSGFDVVLGNPPWEHTELKEKEFFASRDEDVANALGAKRKKMIASLEQDDPTLYAEFVKTKREHDAPSHFVRNSGKYPLCGRGRINTYAIFAELNKDLINKEGRVGCIVPSGIATDDTTKYFFQDILENNRLVSLFEFENDGFFLGAGSGHMVRFVLLTMTTKDGWIPDSLFMFQGHKIDDLRDEEKVFTLSSEDIALINPNTKTCPIFQTKRDAEITKAIYKRVPVLINEDDKENGNPWGISFKQGLFNMTSDSHLFRTREELESEGWVLKGNIFEKGNDKYLPLYEAKMIYHYNHRYGDFSDAPPGKRPHILPHVPLEKLQDPNYCVMPYYWVPKEIVEETLRNYGWKNKWFLGFRDTTDSRASAHTVIPATIPISGVGNKFPLLISNQSAKKYACLQGMLSSFALDYVARQKVGGLTLNYFYFKQFPLLPPEAFERIAPWNSSITILEWIYQRVLSLVYTSWEMESFAKAGDFNTSPYDWDDERRFLTECELNAVMFYIYGIKIDDIEYIMDTFTVLKRQEISKYGVFRTKESIREKYQVLFENVHVTNLEAVN